MPSLVHAIVAFSNSEKTINSIISNGKRFIAYELVKQLEQQNSNLILEELRNTLNQYRNKRRQDA